MLTVSKISSLPSSTFLVQSKRIRERRGDNFRSLLAPPLSLLYTLLPVLNFLPVTVGRRGSRRRSGSRMEGGGRELPPPSSDFYYSTFKYCLFLEMPFLERPTSQSLFPSPSPPFPLFSLSRNTYILILSPVNYFVFNFSTVLIPPPPPPHPPLSFPLFSFVSPCTFYLFLTTFYITPPHNNKNPSIRV